MSIFGALRTAEQAMHVHRFRSETAAENLAHAYTDANYHRKVVNLGHSPFNESMVQARANSIDRMMGPRQAVEGATTGTVYVSGVERDGQKRSERANAMLDTQEMMSSKSAYELNVRVASMLRSMATAALEIGRGA